jgi:hypothetical protein
MDLYNMKIKWDRLAGWSLGLVVIWGVAKYLHPNMTIIEILKIILESQLGWSGLVVPRGNGIYFIVIFPLILFQSTYRMMIYLKILF